MRNIYLWVIPFVFLSSILKSQSDFPYTIAIDTVTIPGLPGLHSYAYAQHEGKWLVLGGRRDGIHARQPFRSFPREYNNDSIFVVDPVQRNVLRRSLQGLSIALQEQLQAGNACFLQLGDTLYIAGGYGFSASENDHITFPYLATISVSGLMSAVENNTSLASHAKQIKDDYFAVSGGHLQTLNNKFYLVGGHRFDGQYNPMGHNTYVQTYTDEVRIFTLNNTSNSILFKKDTVYHDPVHLHRRDYNLLPQMLPNGQEALLISSGVFQIAEDLPFLYPVMVTEEGHEAITAFNQYLSHYHAANVALFNPLDSSMHNLFFGGMSQYHYENGTLIKDDMVPFVRTISRVSRDNKGHWEEYDMLSLMPGLTGSSAEFITHPDAPTFPSGIINLQSLSADSTLIGYIYGGILSPSENPFSFNQTETTKADANIYTVRLVKSASSKVSGPLPAKKEIEVSLFPNPTDKNTTASFNLDKAMTLHYMVTDSQGKLIQKSKPALFGAGEHDVELPLETIPEGVLLITFVFDHIHYVTRSLIRQ